MIMQSIADPAGLGQHPQFQAMAEALAEKAHAALPLANGRIEKAVAIVLSGGVTLHADGHAVVASQSRPHTSYSVNGTCGCPDMAEAPGQWCQHRIAAGIQKRVRELLTASHAPEQPTAVASQPLPEAPSSAHVRIQVHGYEVQVTLRDHDEHALLARLEALLTRYPLPAQTVSQPTGQGKGWCAKHGVPMKQTTKDGRSWYSHKTAKGWCKGR
jgi:hypothetical protein